MTSPNSICLIFPLTLLTLALLSIHLFRFDGDTEYSALFLRDNIFPEDYDVVKVSELMQVYGKMLDFAAEHSLDSKEFTDYIELQGVTTEDHVSISMPFQNRWLSLASHFFILSSGISKYPPIGKCMEQNLEDGSS